MLSSPPPSPSMAAVAVAVAVAEARKAAAAAPRRWARRARKVRMGFSRTHASTIPMPAAAVGSPGLPPCLLGLEASRPCLRLLWQAEEATRRSRHRRAVTAQCTPRACGFESSAGFAALGLALHGSGTAGRCGRRFDGMAEPEFGSWVFPSQK